MPRSSVLTLRVSPEVEPDCVDAPLFRITLPPGARTGLRAVSQVMLDRIVSVPRAAISAEIGHCDSREIEAVEDGLRRWLGLA